MRRHVILLAAMLSSCAPAPSADDAGDGPRDPAVPDAGPPLPVDAGHGDAGGAGGADGGDDDGGAHDSGLNDSGPDDDGGVDAGPARTRGLEERALNLTCALDGAPPVGVPLLDVEPILLALPLTDPVHAVALPAASLLLVVERGGRVLRVDELSDGSDSAVVLDLSARASLGMLGIAVHPSWPAVPKIYLAFVADGPRRVVLSSFTMDASTLVADPDSEAVLLEVPHESGPDGGAPLFGFDGKLYLPLGAGGDDGAASDPAELSGSVLRLDVDATPPHVPADNPFVADVSARGEVWAKGFRDPRCVVDELVGRVFCLDRGVLALELNTLAAGVDYGWPRMDGTTCVDTESGACTDGSLRRPFLEQPDGETCAPRAGLLYRGAELGELSSVLAFGASCGGVLHGVRHDGTNPRGDDVIVDVGEPLSAIIADTRGEPLVFAASGAVYRLQRQQGVAAPAFPTTLSATGCFDDVFARDPAPGLVPFAVRAPLWSDGARKERYVVLPGEEKIGFTTTGAWDVPIGTLLVKTFLFPALDDDEASDFPVETRFLVRRDATRWEGYSYMWSRDGRDAFLLDGGERRQYEVVVAGAAAEHQHAFPSRSDCLLCHNANTGRVLGLVTGRMNTDFDYDGFVDNQLVAMDHIGLFEPALSAEASALPRWPDVEEEAAPVADRARAYLAGNCAHCHQPGGPPQTLIDLRYETPFAEQKLCDEVPLYGDFGTPGARVVKPGDRSLSELFFRITRRGAGQMPPLATSLVDEESTAVVGQWIDGLDSCP